MPTIEFVSTGPASDKTVEVPEGGALHDIADEHLAPIPFSCRSAACGTCHVDVQEGAELLEPPDQDEQDLLDVLDGPDGSRLACQARVKPGAGKIKLLPLC